uniref:Bet v I/Major latex protein domain-containing protein n=1 Tax=Kalanchoe fedtschenkoi TaxID=63787 RepID=A0A7N0U883_KALFE
MAYETKTQAKVSVGIQTLWKALSHDMRFIVPKAFSTHVRDIQLLEGDGGLHSILLFHLSDGASERYQKERIVEFDESSCSIGLEVTEGGKLDAGFSAYTTFFKLTAAAEAETVVDIRVVYQTDTGESLISTQKTTDPTLSFLNCLEAYLRNEV